MASESERENVSRAGFSGWLLGTETDTVERRSRSPRIPSVKSAEPSDTVGRFRGAHGSDLAGAGVKSRARDQNANYDDPSAVSGRTMTWQPATTVALPRNQP